MDPTREITDHQLTSSLAWSRKGIGAVDFPRHRMRGFDCCGI
jgi:hypothetical protein